MPKNTQKIIMIDTETGGTDPNTHALIEVAMIMVIDNNPVDTIDVFMQPVPGKIIEDEALEVNGLTREQIGGFQTCHEGYLEIIRFLDMHISKWDKLDKAISGGHNVSFDLDFLKPFFTDMGNKYLGSYLNWKVLDTRQLATLLEMMVPDAFNFKNHKLATLCEFFEVDLTNAHNALADIEATYLLCAKMIDCIGIRNIPEHAIAGTNQSELQMIEPADLAKMVAMVSDVMISPGDLWDLGKKNYTAVRDWAAAELCAKQEGKLDDPTFPGRMEFPDCLVPFITNPSPPILDLSHETKTQ